MFIKSNTQHVIVEGLVSNLQMYVICVCFSYAGIQHIVCWFLCFLCLGLVIPILPVYLNCPFLIAPSVFSNVFFIYLYF